MTSDARNIYLEALRLTPQERADIAGMLIESLDESDSDNIEAAWRAEVIRRLQEVDDGVAMAVSWEELRRKAADRIG